MRILIISTILSLLMLTCKGQTIDTKITNNSKKDTMEYFDENKYKNLPINPNTGYKIMDNGDEVQYWESAPTHYVLWIYLKNSPYQYYKTFFLKSNQLKYIDNKFYRFSIGKGREYDENGKLIRETDYDMPYKFSIEDLIKKMKNEYNIDLLDVNHIISFSRYEEKKDLNIPLYEVWYNYDSASRNNVECYLINGTTGETMFTIKRYLGDKKGSLLQNYLESLKKNEKRTENQNNKISSLTNPEEKFSSQTLELGRPYVYGGAVPTDTFQIYEDRAYTKAEWEEFQKTLPWWKRIM